MNWINMEPQVSVSVPSLLELVHAVLEVHRDLKLILHELIPDGVAEHEATTGPTLPCEVRREVLEVRVRVPREESRIRGITRGLGVCGVGQQSPPGGPGGHEALAEALALTSERATSGPERLEQNSYGYGWSGRESEGGVEEGWIGTGLRSVDG